MAKLNETKQKTITNFSHILLQFGISIINFYNITKKKKTLKTNMKKKNQIQYQTMAFLTHRHYL